MSNTSRGCHNVLRNEPVHIYLAKCMANEPVHIYLANEPVHIHLAKKLPLSFQGESHQDQLELEGYKR